MEKTIDATEAQSHFEELVRTVLTDGTPVVVEREGEPQVVVVPVAVYRRLREAEGQPRWRVALDRAHEQIRREGERPLIPPPEEVIRQLREERDAQITGLP